MTDIDPTTEPLGYIPAPLPANEEQRLAVVNRLMSHSFDLSKLEALCTQVASTFDVPMAAVTVLDQDWQHFAAQVGVEGDKSTRAIAFCGYTISQQRPMLVLDAQQDVRFAGNPFVTRDPSIRFYAGARLIVAGMPVGALCALGQTPQGDVDPARIDLLAKLAENASAILERQLAGQDPD